MKCILSQDVKINLEEQASPFNQTKFIFDANGCFVASGSILKKSSFSDAIDETTGSEPWVSDDSDYWRFDENDNISSLVLKLPNVNLENTNNIVLPEVSKYFSSVKLESNKKSFVAPPQKFRHFNPAERYLLSTSVESNELLGLTRIKINNHLSFLMDVKNYFSGWVVENPLSIITDDIGGSIDEATPDSFTYKVFAEFFEVVSNNKCEQMDDDMEEVVKLLSNVINEEKLQKIKGSLREKLLVSSIENLKNYFL